MSKDATVQEVLTALRDVPFLLDGWEDKFRTRLLRQRKPLTPEQRTVLVTLAEEYLDPLLAAELRGQQRLFG